MFGRVVLEAMIVVKNKTTYAGPGEYVGRPSPLGNPFAIGRDGTRNEVVAAYREWLDNELNRNGMGTLIHYMIP